MPTREWKIELTAELEYDGDRITVFCNEMPIVGIGRTLGEAAADLRANANAMFSAAKSDGCMEELMQRYGGEIIRPQLPEVLRQSLGPIYLTDIREDESSPHVVFA